MGNGNAVEIGQASHFGIACESAALYDHEIVSHQTAPPRGRYWGGIVIDDHVGIEKEVGIPGPDKFRPWCVNPVPPPESVAPVRFSRMRRGYARHGLSYHLGRAKLREARHTFWGAHLDGERGHVVTLPDKVICLSDLILKLSKLASPHHRCSSP